MINLKCYEISKYNPQYYEYKDGTRFYRVNEWTSVSDIGSVFDGKELTAEEYIKTESAYVEAVRLISKSKGVYAFKWERVQRFFSAKELKSQTSSTPYAELYSDNLLSFYEKLDDYEQLQGSFLDMALRLMLRENIDGILTCPRKLKITVGYDYLMSISSSTSILTQRYDIEKLGLFIM